MRYHPAITAVFMLLCLGSVAMAAGSAPISFDQALSLIISRSTAIGTQEQNYLSTRAANVPAHLYQLPTLNANAKNTSTRVPGIIATERGQQAELSANLNLFRFGADYELAQSAGNQNNQQLALVQNTVLQTEDQAILAMTTVIQRRMELDVYRRRIQIQDETLQIAHQRYDHGLLSQQEVLKALIDKENSQARYADAELLSNDADAALTTLLGSADIETTWPWQVFFSHWNVEDFVAHQEFKIGDRPDWKAAQFNLSAQEGLTSRDYRLILPSFDSSFTYGYYSYNFPGYANGQGWQGVLSVSFPVFDRLTLISNARSQGALATQADIQKTQVERFAASDYTAAQKNLIEAVRSAIDREATVTKSRGLYQDSLRRFKSGISDSNEVLIDQDRLLSSELLALSGWSEAHTALSRYCHDLGKRLQDCVSMK